MLLLKLIKKLYARTKETYGRSIIKSLTYRIYSSFLITPLIAYLVTGNIIIGLTIGATEFLLKPFSYFIFERTFCHLHWGYKNGKDLSPESS